MPHLLLHFIRHIDQSEPIEHSVYVGHSSDIAQSFRAVYNFSFNILQRQNYRTSCQTLTLLPAVDPQLFRVLTVPAFFYFVREWQSRVGFKSYPGIGHNHAPEVFFCRIDPPPLHCSVSPLPLCSDTDLSFFCCAWEVHTFPIWQVRGDGGFGKLQSVCS